MSPSNIRRYTHRVSSVWLPENELNEDDANKHAKLDTETSTRPQSYTKNYRDLGNLEQKCLSPGKSPSIGPENIHKGSAILTDRATFRNILHNYTDICIIIIGFWKQGHVVERVQVTVFGGGLWKECKIRNFITKL